MADLKTDLNKAKLKRMYFGFAPGKDKNSHCLLLDERKAIKVSDVKETALEQTGKTPSKVCAGECYPDSNNGNALIFEVNKGKANPNEMKRLLLQVGQANQVTLKIHEVRLGGEAELDKDGETEQKERETDEQPEKSPKAPPTPSSSTGSSEQDPSSVVPPVAPPPPSVSGADQYRSRVQALTAQLTSALKENRGDTGKMRAVFAFAQSKAEAQDYKSALQSLNSLEALLKAASESAPKDSNATVAYTRSRVEWNNARNQAQAAVAAVQAALRQEFPNEAATAGALAAVLQGFDDRLISVLDEALNAAENDRGRLHQAAQQLVGEYLGLLRERAAMIQHLDNNPFVPCALGETLGKTLLQLDKQLGQLA